MKDFLAAIGIFYLIITGLIFASSLLMNRKPKNKADYVNSLSKEDYNELLAEYTLSDDDYNELLADHLGLNRSSKPMAEIKDYEA